MDLIQVASLGIWVVTLGFLLYSVTQVRSERLMRARTDKRSESLEHQLQELRINSQKMYEDFRKSSRNDSVKWATLFDGSSSSWTMQHLPDNPLPSKKLNFRE